MFFFYRKKKIIACNQVHLLVPVGESHHDIQRGQTEVEVEKRVAVSDSILLIVHSPADAVLSHHTLFNRPSRLGLHELVHLSVTGRTDTSKGTERVSVKKKYEHITTTVMVPCCQTYLAYRVQKRKMIRPTIP